MSTHNICLRGEIRKYYVGTLAYLELHECCQYCGGLSFSVGLVSVFMDSITTAKKASLFKGLSTKYFP